MSNQMELAVEERTASGKQVRQLRKRGIVPANLFGRHLPSMSLQVNGLTLQKLLAHGGKDVILLLKVGDRPAVPALIKKVEHATVSGTIEHVDFYLVNAAEKLRTQIRLQFVNEAGAASQGDVLVQRPLNEVTVECLPADLPAAIQVDLSMLSELDATIRVRDLAVGPGVTILTDQNETVAAVHLQAHLEKTEDTDGKAEAGAATPGTTAGGGTERS
ncbi:MAG: 50S ribosomal protein L25 [Chloroflexota bacterium]